MPLFIATQKSPPADHDMISETTRVIVDAADGAGAMEAFQAFAQAGYTVEMTDEAPDQAWVQEQKLSGRLLPGKAQAYSAPLK